MKILITLCRTFSLLTGVLTLPNIKFTHPMTLVSHAHQWLHEFNRVCYIAEYSEYLDGAEFQDKGDEWLPLGSKYQKHVECFVRYEKISYAYFSVTLS